MPDKPSKTKQVLNISGKLVMNKVREHTVPASDKKGDKVHKVDQVVFHIRENVPRGTKPKVLTPFLTLDGEFFSEFLDTGRPEIYDVDFLISATRSKFQPSGIPEKDTPPDKE